MAKKQKAICLGEDTKELTRFRFFKHRGQRHWLIQVCHRIIEVRHFYRICPYSLCEARVLALRHLTRCTLRDFVTSEMKIYKNYLWSLQ